MSNYAYANARARARHASLFPPQYLSELTGQDVPQIIGALESSKYRQFISEAVLAKPTPHGIDEALHKSMAQDFRDFLEFLEDEGKELLGIVLGIWDVFNIKTILRGKHVSASTDEIISNLIPAGELDFATLTELAKETDVIGVINLLATWRIPYGRPLSIRIREYSETQDLVFLEKALDEYFYRLALEKAGRKGENARIVRQLLEERIDLINLMNLARCVKEEVPLDTARSLFLKDGATLSIERLSELLETTPGVPEVIDVIKGTRYGQALPANIGEQVEMEGLPPLERTLERYLFEKGVSFYRGDPLSLAVILGYLFAKWNEVINLRVIIRGKWVEMPVDKIKEALVLVG